MWRFIMDAWLLFLIIVYLTSSEVDAGQRTYTFDKKKYCLDNSALTQTLMLTDEVILQAKSGTDSYIDKIKSFLTGPVTECEMRFMTSSMDSNMKQALQIEFDSFSIARDACDVKLLIQQSPSQFFTEDVTEMASLTCGSPKPPILHTEVGFVARFQFYRPDDDKKYFHFKISIKRSDGIPKEEGMSVGVKIGITVIAVAAAITLLLLVYKFIKLRCETRDIENADQNSDHGMDPDEMENLRDSNDDNNFVMTDFPYANMPLVILNGDEAPPDYKDIAPPAYEQAIKMPKAIEAQDEATYSNLETLNNDLRSNSATSQSSITGNTEVARNQSNSSVDSESSQSDSASNAEQGRSQPDIATSNNPSHRTN